MTKEFVPLTEDELNWQDAVQFLAMADGAISHPCVDSSDEPSFQDVWWVLCHMLARDDQIQKENLAGAETVERIMCSNFTTPKLAILGTYALLESEAFLHGVERQLDAIVVRLEDDATADPHLAAELTAFRDEIPGMIDRLSTETAENCGDAWLPPAREGREQSLCSQ